MSFPLETQPSTLCTLVPSIPQSMYSSIMKVGCTVADTQDGRNSFTSLVIGVNIKSAIGLYCNKQPIRFFLWSIFFIKMESVPDERKCRYCYPLLCNCLLHVTHKHEMQKSNEILPIVGFIKHGNPILPGPVLLLIMLKLSMLISVKWRFNCDVFSICRVRPLWKHTNAEWKVGPACDINGNENILFRNIVKSSLIYCVTQKSFVGAFVAFPFTWFTRSICIFHTIIYGLLRISIEIKIHWSKLTLWHYQ